MTISPTAGEALHAVTLTEATFTTLHDLIPRMDDDQLIATYQRADELGKRAWLVQAHCLWEARARKQRQNDDALTSVARGFSISREWARKLADAWESVEPSTRIDGDLPLAKSFYIEAGQTTNPPLWIAHAEDRKAENPTYSVRDFRADIEQDQHLFADPVADPWDAPEALPARHAVHFTSDTPEWYTPPAIIETVVDFFDAIDLDPCSNSKSTPNVPAAQHWTQDDNGLIAPWHGRVYVNPPYGREIGGWVARAVHAYERREIEAAILLVPARTDTEWFRRLRDFPICFIGGRVRFIGPDGEADAAPFPSALIYIGDETERYARTVAHLGDVWTRYPTEAA